MSDDGNDGNAPAESVFKDTRVAPKKGNKKGKKKKKGKRSGDEPAMPSISDILNADAKNGDTTQEQLVLTKEPSSIVFN